MTIMVIICRVMAKQTVIALLSNWPDRRSVLEDARSVDPDLDLVAVHRWFQRGNIPVKYWSALIEGGRKRGHPFGASEFVNAHNATEGRAA